jgi:hypothetical protein
MRIYRQNFEQSSFLTRQIKMATVKGTAQNKRKREPNESTRTSRELFNALVILLERQTTSIMEDLNVLIANYTEKDLREAVLEKDDDGELPIHTACLKNAPAEVIRLLLDSDTEKKTILAKTSFARLPIHLACFQNASYALYYGEFYESTSVEVIQLLLDSDDDNKTIFEKDRLGRLPIHLACEEGAPAEVIRLLLDSDTDKKSILEKDGDGQLPIHLACLNNGHVEVIQLLLQVSMCDRIEQLGLARWKIGVEKLINDMTADDSKTKKVQEIYARLSKCEEMKHTMSLLALVVWRTSCLHWGDFKFKSIQEMEDLRATDDAFDPAKYKRERGIKSGADVIIRGVLPFLDGETPTPQTSSSAG